MVNVIERSFSFHIVKPFAAVTVLHVFQFYFEDTVGKVFFWDAWAYLLSIDRRCHIRCCRNTFYFLLHQHGDLSRRLSDGDFQLPGAGSHLAFSGFFVLFLLLNVTQVFTVYQ